MLVTGSEILLGMTQDRNSGWLGRELEVLGVELRRVVTVGDEQAAIEDGLRSLAGCDLIMTSGGLGPTHDDRTVAAVAAVAGVQLALHEPTLQIIDERTSDFARQRGRDPATYREGNRKQAMVPEGCEILEPVGTAPGVVVEWGGSVVVVLPGPPSELAAMWQTVPARSAVARVLARAGRMERRTLRVYGTSESAVANAFREAGGDGAGTLTTICAHRLEIEVTIRADAAALAAADALAESMASRLAPAVYARDERPLEVHLLEALRARGWRVATAESCTAGLVAARITEIPGSSDTLVGGVVAYANDIKRELLDVPASLLEAHGAVSAECAEAMAQGARRRLGTEAAVAVTGIAGPGGGTPEKPVGLVYFHVSTPAGERAHSHVFPPRRETVREWASTVALQLLRIEATRAA